MPIVEYDLNPRELYIPIYTDPVQRSTESYFLCKLCSRRVSEGQVYLTKEALKYHLTYFHNIGAEITL